MGKYTYEQRVEITERLKNENMHLFLEENNKEYIITTANINNAIYEAIFSLASSRGYDIASSIIFTLRHLGVIDGSNCNIIIDELFRIHEEIEHKYFNI